LQLQFLFQQDHQEHQRVQGLQLEEWQHNWTYHQEALLGGP
jgi:hypothetical protein